MRALKYIVSKYQNPFNELRQRIYGFSELKGSYIIPTQVECCLQLCMVELDLLEDVKHVRLSLSEAHFNKLKNKILNSDSICNSREDGLIICDISLRNIYLGYFKYLLPWPTYYNNLMRHAIAWIVKYFGFFSEKFVSIHYGDEVYDKPGNIQIKKGIRRVFKNPNLYFVDDESSHKEYIEMLNLCVEIPELYRLCQVCMFIQFDPSNRSYVRLLRMLLMLPMMGGFGRTNKYIVAPRSAENDDDIVNNIGDVVKNNMMRLHREAVTNGFEPVRGNDWQRVTCGFYKSTASAEKVKLSVKIDGSDRSISVRTKALVGLVKGSKVFTSDMEAKYITNGYPTSLGTTSTFTFTNNCKLELL